MRPCILVLADVYLPGYLAGGPVRSLANLVRCLGDEFTWKVITTDRDLHANVPYADTRPDQWVHVEGAEVYYASPQSLAFRKMLRLIASTPHDILYLNSFFSPRFSILPMLARRFGRLPNPPVLIAPRGEFSAGAYSLKRWKKTPFVHLTKLFGLYEDAHWHVSTALEAKDTHSIMGAAWHRMHVACDLAQSDVSSASVAVHSPDDPLRVCFLSRISRKKNLDFALQVLAKVESRVVFTVYGPMEDATYWAECERLAKALPAHVAFNYAGALPHEKVRGELAKNDLFFLPTRGENYGHVLVEAWSAGLPVLTSDQTPWRGLKEAGVGWDLPLSDLTAFARTINDVASWASEKRQQARTQCLTFIRQHLQDETVILDNRRMFSGLANSLNGGVAMDVDRIHGA